MSDRPYTLYGALASPYSMKMRALLRYRRIPFVWKYGAQTQEALGRVKVPVIPVLEMPDGMLANDSTALIYALEDRHAGRSIVPPDRAMAFLAHLIEDFADEWLTKAMFGYRWLAEVDQVQMSRWLAFDSLKGGGRGKSQGNAEQFRQRQVGRMAIVGCTAENFPLIEATTRDVLDTLEARVTEGFFLFGSRPSLAEFGIYGQLSQLGVDPTPQAMMRRDYPYSYRWLDHIDDLSGHDGEWSAEPDETALRIAGIAGEVPGRSAAALCIAILRRERARGPLDRGPLGRASLRLMVPSQYRRCAARISLIAESYERLLGQPLVEGKDTVAELWQAAPAIVAHGTEADPIFFFGNRTALRLFDASIEQFTMLPSRMSAEAPLRAEREELMDRVRTQGFIDDYAGVRIALSGNRFRIERATVWNLIDAAGAIRGQAAAFADWSPPD